MKTNEGCETFKNPKVPLVVEEDNRPASARLRETSVTLFGVTEEKYGTNE